MVLELEEVWEYPLFLMLSEAVIRHGGKNKSISSLRTVMCFCTL